MELMSVCCTTAVQSVRLYMRLFAHIRYQALVSVSALHEDMVLSAVVLRA